MRAHESVALSNKAAGTYPLGPINGGKYLWAYLGTGTGTVDLQMLGPDGVTFIKVATQIIATSGSQVVDLPPGTYSVVIATFTASYASLTRIPEE